LAAVDRLLPYVHKSIADELKSVAVKEREVSPRLLAVRGLQSQDKKLASKHLWSAYNSSNNQESQKVRKAILDSLFVVEYCPPTKDLLRGIDRMEKDEQKAICMLIRYCRDMDSVEFLGTRLEMPQPDDVDSPTNPPAEYWREKVEVWTHCIEAVHGSILHLTGRDFADEKEMKQWRKGAGKIIPLEEAQKLIKKHQ
jgi:hypothetical protein